MTGKERVMKALDFEPPDRMPRFDGFWSEFVENWRHKKRVSSGIRITDYYEIDMAVCVADETFFPSSKGIIGREGDYLISRDGWGRTIRTAEGGYFMERIEGVLEDKSNLDKLEFEPATLDSRYADFLAAVQKEQRKRCVFCKIGGPFIRSSFLRGEEDFLIDLVADPPFAKALVGRVAEHLLAIGLESLARADLYDTGIWIYDDMGANDAPMFSPNTFEEVFFPLYEKMVHRLKEAGARKVILHSDGNIVPFLDMLIEAGIDGINPVEPRAGMHLLKLREKYGKKLTYIGGVCNALILPKGDQQEIAEHIRPILEAGRKGGMVIGTHSVGPDISVETYDFYHSLVRKYGDYRDNGPISFPHRSEGNTMSHEP